MSVKKFKFVSPGIFMNEIDKSILEAAPEVIGPLVIGRSVKGPAGTPIKVRSYAEFVEIFGEPIPGVQTGDVFRDGNKLAPTYGSYAAKAWLSNNAPLTFIRLLGEQHTLATTAGKAGWGGGDGTSAGIAKVLLSQNARTTPNEDVESAGGAYGLWLFNGSDQIENQGLTTATVIDAIQASVVGDDKAFTINVPTTVGGTGTTYKFVMKPSSTLLAGGMAANEIWVLGLAGDTAATRGYIKDAINGTATTTVAKYHSGISTLATTGVVGVSAEDGTTTTTVTLKATSNLVLAADDTDGLILANTNGSMAIDTDFIMGAVSPGTNTDANPAKGSLAAIFYCDQNTTMVLSGAFDFDKSNGSVSQYTASHAVTIGTGSAASSPGTLSMLIGTPGQILSSSNQADTTTLTGLHTGVEKVDFTFNRSSDDFVRKVFNTNPTLTNTVITTTDNQKGYFLGESYEGFLDDKVGGWGSVTHGLMLPLKSRNFVQDGADWRFGRANAQTGWYISQDTGNSTNYDNESVQKLFRLISLNQGEWLQNNLKISIEDLKFPNDKYNRYGTFTVAIRFISDRDSKPQYVEVFKGLNLNPHSANYIKRRIGDKYLEWNTVEERYREYGEYPNQSKFLRVAMNEDVDNGAGEGLLPFGVYGPYRFLNALNVTGGNENGLGTYDATAAGAETQGGLTGYHMIVGDQAVGIPYAKGSTSGYNCLFSSSLNASGSSGVKSSVYTKQLDKTDANTHIGSQMSSSFYFPELPLRDNSNEGDIDNPKKAFWGVRTERSASNIFDESVRDLIRAMPGGIDSGRDTGGTYTEISWVFSLDDLVEVNPHVRYASGSRKDGSSYTATSGSDTGTGNTGAKKLVNEKKWNRFTTLLHGGFDGFDITEKEPLRNSLLDDASGNATVNYAYNTVKQAIQSIKDADLLEYNIATIPGVTETNLTNLLVDQCEERADALAIIDLQNNTVGEGNYQPYTENSDTERSRIDSQDINLLRKKLEDREINSSYGCTYYPWVQIRDERTAAVLKVPPSVVALGAMAFSDAQQAPWFAPAGFTRGGLSFGASGLNVVGVTHKLTSEDRDKLYEANINPIATFPAEGIVIFGQKTLQLTPSALDRINVRRLLIFVKKEVSRIAATTLFEQNVRATWVGFRNRAESFLSSVKSQLGLVDYKVILDETTTTPDLIDRNIMYAKIFLKPARSIEFIALDFIITDSGASFED